MNTYSLKFIEDLINQYINKGGEIAEVEEGCLGYGTTICFGDGLKYAVIEERFQNSWSSTHTIKMYNKLPNKYEVMLKNY